MVFLMMVAAMLAVIGYYVFLLPPVTRQAQDGPAAEVAAAAILVHQKAAVDWCLRTNCADGIVPSNGLTLPPGYGAASWVQSVTKGGLVSTYVSGLNVNSLAIAASLGDLTAGGPSAGLTGSNATVLTRDLVTPGRIAAPVVPGIPAGVPVVSQQVK